jgi:hypothetical protein
MAEACFQIKSGVIICNKSKGAKKNFDQRKIKKGGSRYRGGKVVIMGGGRRLIFKKPKPAPVRKRKGRSDKGKKRGKYKPRAK